MSKIEFSSQQRERIVQDLQTYFEQELATDLGQFDAEFLLDFIAKNIGAHFYNKGLQDARDIFQAKVENIDEDLYAIEQTVF